MCLSEYSALFKYIYVIRNLFAKYINFDMLQITFFDFNERRVSNLLMVGQLQKYGLKNLVLSAR